MPWACRALASNPGVRAGQAPSRWVTAPTPAWFPRLLPRDPQPVPSAGPSKGAGDGSYSGPGSGIACSLPGWGAGVSWLPAVAATSGFSPAAPLPDAGVAWVSISPSSLARHVQSVCRLLLLTAAPPGPAWCDSRSQLLEAVRVRPGKGCSVSPTPFLGVSTKQGGAASNLPRTQHRCPAPGSPTLRAGRVRCRSRQRGVPAAAHDSPDQESISRPDRTLPAGIAALSKQETLALC